jgi:hypothetical protein
MRISPLPDQSDVADGGVDPLTIQAQRQPREQLHRLNDGGSLSADHLAGEQIEDHGQ